jgi:hypothetical protein
MAAGLSDAFNTALQGLQGNFSTNIVNGTNPLSQPQVTSLYGFNIPGVPLISTRDYFLLQLQSWLTSIPLQSQWIALVDTYPAILNTGFLQTLERTDGGKKGYDISIAKTLLTSYPFQKVIGCLFAQGALVPGERYNIESADIGNSSNNKGFIPGIVAKGRTSYDSAPLSLTFLETNTSILDFVFRPWIMAVSHQGLVARPRPQDKVTCNITLMNYTRSYQNVSQIPRKVFTFYNCAPYEILQQNWSYDEPGSAPVNTVNFTYTNYTIQNSMYLPLADIITTVQGIVNGNYTPVVSPLQNSNNFPTNAASFF